MAADQDLHRYELQARLKQICDNVYFDPPENIRMSYPCIVYERSRGDHQYSNDKTYVFTNGYSLTVISANPDDSLRYQLIDVFPKMRFDRHYVADGLHHDVFTLYY